MLPRNRNARRVDDVSFDASGPQPARQPEAVAAGFEGDHHACDHASGLYCLITPPVPQLQSHLFVAAQFFQRVALDSRHNSSDEPTVQTHFDNRNNRVVLSKRHERSAEIVLICHGGAPLIRDRRRGCTVFAGSPHSISKVQCGYRPSCHLGRRLLLPMRQSPYKLRLLWPGSRENGLPERRRSASVHTSLRLRSCKQMMQGAPSQWCWAGSMPWLIMRRIVEGLTARAVAASLTVTSPRSLRSPSR